MALLTFQVLEGMERGRVLRDLRTPVSIGREEENSVQLNDERVSRYHAKVQEDNSRVILTDLESTNGTRVNGHPVQMHVLHVGDQVTIGRCVLLYGSSDEIEDRVRARRKVRDSDGTFDLAEAHVACSESEQSPLDELPVMFPDGLPELPEGLRPLQVAQLVDVLAHLHDRLRSVIVAARSAPDSSAVPELADGSDLSWLVDWPAWQRLLKVEMDMATCLRRLTTDDSESPLES